MTISNEAIKVAAKWWTDQLRQPAKLDNSDMSGPGAALACLASLSSYEEHGDDSLARYQAELEQLLQEQADRTMIIVHCDYDADRILLKAAENAGIKCDGMTTFPWKTVMWVRPESVVVSAGYRAPDETLWSAPTPEIAKTPEAEAPGA